MASCKRSMVVLALVVIMAVARSNVEAVILCGTVRSSLLSCLSYLEGRAASPGGACCSGVVKLYNLTKPSRPDRVTSCGCIKQLAASLGGLLQDKFVGALPGKCGVSLGYTPSVNINCNSIP